MSASRGAFSIVWVFSFFLNLLFLTSPLYMLQIYDRVLGSGRVETLTYLTIIAIVALVVFGLLEGLRMALLSRIGAWLHDKVGAAVMQASMRTAINNTPVGAQGLRDLQQVQSFISSQGVVPFFDAPWVPIFVVIIWMLHPFLGMMAAGAVVLLFLVAVVNDMITRNALMKANGASGQALREAERALVNSETIQAMGMLPAVTARWQAGSEEAQLMTARAVERGGWITGLSRFLRFGVQVGILGLGALLVLQNQLTPGGMIAGSILLGRALAPVEQSIGAWRGFNNVQASYRRLQELLTKFDAGEEAMELPEPKGNLALEGVFISKPGGPDKGFILQGVTFNLPAGQVLAIAGPSAAGKSTLCRAVCGVIRPLRGHVRLDGADLAQWPQHQLGPAIGYLPQAVELFSGTVRENIARMTEGSADAVTAAAQLARVHEMILQLPDGYDTDIGPGGAHLSGGQRQRIGLARAVYGNPKLVVLDEPNSNLDQDGEVALIEAIKALKAQGTTVIIVAHRQSALAVADKLMVLNQGRIDMFDDRDKALAALKERQRGNLKVAEANPQKAESTA